MLERKAYRTPTGILSEEIFGRTQKEKMKKYAYIDLKRKFFHPLVYETLIKLFRKTKTIVNGEGSWYIDDTGKLLELDEKDERYSEDNTGLDWLINNYRRIVFADNESTGRKDRLKFLRSLTEEETFISKWLVIPVFYRDIVITDGQIKKHDLSDKYNDLIRYTNSLEVTHEGVMAWMSNRTLANIQETLVEIRKYGQRFVEKKQGAFHQNVLGKSIDNGARAVISTPVLTGVELPEDNPIDIQHSGIPLAKCIETGFPFVLHFCEGFFRREFDGINKMPVVVYKPDGTSEDIYKPIKDMTTVYTTERIRKQMKKFIHTPGSRFETIKIEFEDGTSTDLILTGIPLGRALDHPESSELSKRAMTWTDLFYYAAVETLEDKCCWITRYPLESYFGIFPSRVICTSTINTTSVTLSGITYPRWPSIDLSMTISEIEIYFIDTLQISNLFLEAIGGDYDGDMCSIRILFSQEANAEAESIINDVKHFVSIQGELVRNIGNEAFLTFYGMTK
jgi:hypothetical protein